MTDWAGFWICVGLIAIAFAITEVSDAWRAISRDQVKLSEKIHWKE